MQIHEDRLLLISLCQEAFGLRVCPLCTCHIIQDELIVALLEAEGPRYLRISDKSICSIACGLEYLRQKFPRVGQFLRILHCAVRERVQAGKQSGNGGASPCRGGLGLFVQCCRLGESVDFRRCWS